MKIKKRCFIVILAILMAQVCLLASCGTEKNNMEIREETPVTELNNRQISICEDLGLPASYDELTAAQQKRIMRIEELLQYLDKKYGESFHYAGYRTADTEKESLTVYTDRFSIYECATLTVQSDGSFTDDYPFQFVKRMALESVLTYLGDETGYSYKFYVVGGDTGLTDLSVTDLADVPGDTWISFTAFVSGDQADKNAELIGKKIAAWYESNHLYGSTNVVCVDGDILDTINFANYTSVKREQGLKNLVVCDVDPSGGSTIS